MPRSLGRLCLPQNAIRSRNRIVSGGQAHVRRHADRDRRDPGGGHVRGDDRRRSRRTRGRRPFGEGTGSRHVQAVRRQRHSGARRHRIHLGARPASVLPTRQDHRGDVRKQQPQSCPARRPHRSLANTESKRPRRIAIGKVLKHVPKNTKGDQHGAPISYAAGDQTVALLDETIGANFERTAARHPGVEALVDVPTGRRWTYAELDAEINRIARGLMAGGIEQGDRVGIWAPNCAEWVILQYATAKIGAILVTINPAYRTHELAYVLTHSGVRMLFSANDFKGSDYRAMVAEVRPEVPALNDVVFLGTPDWDRLREGADDTGEEDLRSRMDALSPSDPINIQYTSGTTGSPKGAVLSHRNILNNGYFVTDLINFSADDRLCIPVPFYHCFGMVMGNLGCTTHGAT
ncbi:MAG: hypothetical protein E6Q57_21215, partial [Mycobacterium sp.]